MRLIALLILLTATAAWAAEPPQFKACSDVVGRKLAERLSAQCRMASPATRPPCHPLNSCDLIMGEIRRSCLILIGGLSDEVEPVPPNSPVLSHPDTAFCRDYVDIAGDVQPSFDCSKARSNPEKTICANNELAELDVALANIYTDGLAAETITPPEQQTWLAQRDATCKTLGDAACLKTAISARISELRLIEQGLAPANSSAQTLAYKDLIGTWEVRAVRVFGDGILPIGNDDAAYMNAAVTFSANKITWLKGTERRPLKNFDNCDGQPHLSHTRGGVSHIFEVPGEYLVMCGDRGWGPGSSDGGTTVIRRLNANAVQLYWYDGSLLTLKRAN